MIYDFRCEECGCTKYADTEGSGKDEYGEFEDYICSRCRGITRIYYEEEEEMKTMFNKELIKITSNESGGSNEYDYDYFAEGFEEWATNLEIDLPDVEDLKLYLDEEGYNVEIEEN